MNFAPVLLACVCVMERFERALDPRYGITSIRRLRHHGEGALLHSVLGGFAVGEKFNRFRTGFVWGALIYSTFPEI
jgi:hypothetical protein